jgi:hypothetical protein
MPASPARIPMMTSDGVVLSRVDAALRAVHPNAVDEGGTEREYFFDSEADTAVLVDEYWNWRKTPGRPHEAIEVEVGLGLGTTTPVAPAVPQLLVTDADRSLAGLLKVRAFAVDHGIDRHSVEVLG